MKKENLYISLVNHASVLVEKGHISILSDPWYFGSAFHEGWSLIHENKESEIKDILNNVTHVWISHEHPDHFSVGFLKAYKDLLISKGIKFLFQETKDKRVVSFLQSQGFHVEELQNKKEYTLSDEVRITCIKSSFYDSALKIQAGNKIILNLNDCPERDEKELRKFFKDNGLCDILLTQFSYAAWKGGIKNKTWREEAAQEKITNIINQAKILGAKYVIPFASFIRFSNKSNSYLNDSINDPVNTINALHGQSFQTLFLKPLEKQNVQNLKQKESSLDFWEDLYNKIPNQDLLEYEKVESIDHLNESFNKFKKRLFKNNSRLFMKLLKQTRLFGAFQPITIKLKDFKECIEVDLFSENLKLVKKEYDVSLESKSLDFIFNNTFGFDTLTVNGCFEEGIKGGFSKASKLLALENLNNLGISLNPSIIFNINILIIFFRLLSKVSNKMT